eukprot:374159-Hanusia_phi.AAC.2
MQTSCWLRNSSVMEVMTPRRAVGSASGIVGVVAASGIVGVAASGIVGVAASGIVGVAASMAGGSRWCPHPLPRASWPLPGNPLDGHIPPLTAGSSCK